MDHIPPVRALLATIDRALTDQGVNPDLVSDDDKILLAVQYAETAMERERMAITIPPEETAHDRMCHHAPRTS
jgi:hypothetical protein